MARTLLSIVGLIIFLIGGFVLWQRENSLSQSLSLATPTPVSVTFSVSPVPILTPTPIPSPSPSPSPQPSPDSKVYGPCSLVPVLLYHHIQPVEEAQTKSQKSISVNNDIFAQQMQYLREKGYHTLTPDEFSLNLVNGAFAAKSVL